MILSGFMALQLAAQVSTMHVGAVVVRPSPRPLVAVEGGRILVRVAEGVTVGAEGGRVSRARDGAVIVDPERPLVRIVLTY
jgi:hypothetical protein